MKILLLLCLLIPSTSFAKGSFIAAGNYYKSTGDLKPTIGLAIYEKLGAGLAYNSWTGFGEGYPNWISTKQTMEIGFGKITLGTGFQLDYDPETQDITDSLFMKVAYRLWD